MYSIKHKFSLKIGPRRHFVRILAAQLIMNGRMETTEIRAKEIRPIVEKLLTIGKRHRLQDLRLLLQRLPKEAAMKMYHEIAPKYIERKGGYTRIIKSAGVRKRDGTRTAMIEFV